jgi:hypothetical protein
VARLCDALARRAPLVLLLEDLHWVDGASLDLLRYLGHSWKEHGSRVLLLGTVRREGLEPNPQLSAQLADLGRDLPLSQQETTQLVQAIVGEGAPGTQREGERREHGPAQPSMPGASPPPSDKLEKPLGLAGRGPVCADGGQPLYLLETLKLWRDRQWLAPRLGADGSWHGGASRTDRKTTAWNEEATWCMNVTARADLPMPPMPSTLTTGQRSWSTHWESCTRSTV